MSAPEEFLPGPLERAYRRALEADSASDSDDADRQRRRAAVLAQVAALDADQRRKRMAASAVNRPSWLMLGGSALALVLTAGLVWQLNADREAAPQAGTTLEGVKVAAAPTPSPPPPAAVQAPQAAPPRVEAGAPSRAAQSAARGDAAAKVARPPAEPMPPVAAVAEATAQAQAQAADVAVAQAPAPAMRDLAPPPAAPAMRQRAESMAPPAGAAALQATPEPSWVALIRNDDRAGLRAALDAGLEVDAVDALERTPLMHAVLNARPELIAELLARSASRTRVDRFGLSAAQYAARSPDARVRAALNVGP